MKTHIVLVAAASPRRPSQTLQLPLQLRPWTFTSYEYDIGAVKLYMCLWQARDAEGEKSPYTEYVNIYCSWRSASERRFLSYSPFLSSVPGLQDTRTPASPGFHCPRSHVSLKRPRGGGESCRVVVVLPPGSGVCASACVRRGHVTNLGLRDAFLLDASKFAHDILYEYQGRGGINPFFKATCLLILTLSGLHA